MSITLFEAHVVRSASRPGFSGGAFARLRDEQGSIVEVFGGPTKGRAHVVAYANERQRAAFLEWEAARVAFDAAYSAFKKFTAAVDGDHTVDDQIPWGVDPVWLWNRDTIRQVRHYTWIVGSSRVAGGSSALSGERAENSPEVLAALRDLLSTSRKVLSAYEALMQLKTKLPRPPRPPTTRHILK